VEVVGVRRLTMKWKTYWEDIVTVYRVKIEGWPAGIDSLPLTQACSGVGDTERLLKSWESGETSWHKLTKEECAIEKQK